MALTYTGGVTLKQGSFTSTITPIPFATNAVHFDGTNDYLTRGGSIGGGNTKTATVSLWLNINVDTSNMTVINNDQGRFGIAYTASVDKLLFLFQDGGGTMIWFGRPTTTHTSSSGWVHLLVSFDSAVPSSRKLYIDDTVEVITSETFNADGIIPWTGPSDWGIGAEPTGSGKVNGDLADFWIDNSYIDLTVESNRRKFIDGFGKPVDLGSDGSTPTGSSPLLFFSGVTDSWHTNKGTEGGFTENGALTDASSSPSD